MSFKKKEWKDRISEYPSRRILTTLKGEQKIYEISRNEGAISQEGDAFSAKNMNDLEERIAQATSTTQKTDVMSFRMWKDGYYSYEKVYPADEYNIEIQPDGDRIDKSQLNAWNSAMLVGCLNENKIKALNKQPNTDIPVILTIIEKQGVKEWQLQLKTWVAELN